MKIIKRLTKCVISKLVLNTCETHVRHVFSTCINPFTAKNPSLELIITKILAKQEKLV